MSAAADGVVTFAYHRSLTPMLGALLGLAIAETIVVHLIAYGLWGWRVAAILAAIDLGLVASLVALLRSFRRLPVTIARGRVTLRAGMLRTIAIDAANVAEVRETIDAAMLKQPGVANLALAAWPNVFIALHRPVAGRRGRGVVAIAHRLDEPQAFVTALAAARGA